MSLHTICVPLTLVEDVLHIITCVLNCLLFLFSLYINVAIRSYYFQYFMDILSKHRLY